MIKLKKDMFAELKRTVKNGQKPAEKQHRLPENKMYELQKDYKQNSKLKQRKKSQNRGI